MRIAPFVFTCALAVVPVGGCSTDEPAPPPSDPLAVDQGDYTIAVSGDARTIRLLRRGEALLTFDNHGFQLGTVPELLPNRSYDPWWYEPEEGNAKIAPPEGLAWRDVTTARITGRDPGTAVVELDFDGGAHGRLTIRTAAPGRFVLSLQPTDVPAGQQVAMMRLRPRASITEGFYGLGEWGDDVNHRGHLRPMQLEADLTFENATDENHAPVPLLIGTRGWGLFVQSRRVGAGRRAVERARRGGGGHPAHLPAPAHAPLSL